MEGTKEEGRKAVEKAFSEAFSKGVFMIYQDERVEKECQFIRANPDGSVDLVGFDTNTGEFHLVALLLEAGKGRFAHLAPIN